MMLNNIINKVKSLLGITVKAGNVEVTVTAVNDQITDSVTQAPVPVKKPRAPRKSAKKSD